MTFADRLNDSCEKTKSFICAGFDPRLEDLPKFVLDQASASGKTTEESIFAALTGFYALVLEAIAGKVACIKPNIAFFEQYGLGGVRAFSQICETIRERKIPLIIDAKRGDIGSTAEAYAAAFLSGGSAFGQKTFLAEADALTVSPFLGFDTVEVFLKACAEHGKGIFVLVKTSNPGSAAIQGQKTMADTDISDQIANWLSEKASTLVGRSGISGLGAVVGATYPEQARRLRALMPKNLFLIPGLGSQGGSAADAVAGFTKDGRGGVINVSRGLFSKECLQSTRPDELQAHTCAALDGFNAAVAQALGGQG